MRDVRPTLIFFAVATIRKAKERDPGIGLMFGIMFFFTSSFEDQGNSSVVQTNPLSLVFKEIDGKALLLMSRNDVLTGMSIKLGPALKIYVHVARLQSQNGTIPS